MVFYNILIFFNMLILTEKGAGAGSTPVSPAESASRASTIFGQNRLGDACPSLGPPASLPFRHSLGDHALRLQSGLRSFLPTNPELRFVRISPRRRWPQSTAWSTYLCGPPALLSGQLLSPWQSGSGGPGPPRPVIWEAPRHQPPARCPFPEREVRTEPPCVRAAKPLWRGCRRAPGGEPLPR